MSLIIIWIYFHRCYNRLQSMSKAALNSVLAYVPEALNSLRLTYKYGGGWLCGWRQLIQCIWGDGSRAEYKHTVMGALGNAEGGYLSDCSLYTYTYPRALPSHVINQTICLPSGESCFWIWSCLWESGREKTCLSIPSHEHTLLCFPAVMSAH